MTISEMIKNLPENLTSSDVRGALEESFSLNRKYSALEKAILSAFTGTTFSVDAGEIKFFDKDLTGGMHSALKDLQQSVESGMFLSGAKPSTVSEDQQKANSWCDVVCNKIVERIEEVITGRTKGLLGKEKVVPLDNMYSEIVSGDKGFKCVVNSGSQYKSFVDQGDIEDFDKIDGRSYLRDIFLSRKVIGYLSAFLTVEEGELKNVSDSSDIVAGSVEYLRTRLGEELAKVAEICADNDFQPCTVHAVKMAACKLADGFINENNPGKNANSIQNFVNYMKLAEIETFAPDDFKDIPLGGFDGGSNYNLAFINNMAKKVKYYGIEDCNGRAEAESILQNTGVVDECLKSFKFFDKRMLQGERDQVVDTFEEGAWVCLANLAIAEKIGNAEVKKAIVEMFGVPFAQCLDRIDDVKAIIEKAREKVAGLDLGTNINVIPAAQQDAPASTDTTPASVPADTTSATETPATTVAVTPARKINPMPTQIDIDVKKEFFNYLKRKRKAIIKHNESRGVLLQENSDQARVAIVHLGMLEDKHYKTGIFSMAQQSLEDIRKLAVPATIGDSRIADILLDDAQESYAILDELRKISSVSLTADEWKQKKKDLGIMQGAASKKIRDLYDDSIVSKGAQKGNFRKPGGHNPTI